jgi:dienelactone hydrolase
MTRLLAALTSILAGMAVLTASGGATPAAPSAATGTTEAIVTRDYDLGIRRFRQPGGSGKFATMPIRLWGTIAAPASPGPHPVVLVAHGAHGDNCPGEYGDWPCFASEQRNDLGLRYLVKALARAGFVAVAPDVNAAHTGGWGEPREQPRFNQVVDATLAEVARASNGVGTRFGVALKGKADTAHVGLLGHSRGGMNILAWARGKSRVKSVFLLAPFHDPATRIADVPATVLLGTCDGDTGLAGAKYVTAAQRSARTTPLFQVTLAAANHNFYNQTLARLKLDDNSAGRGACAPARRLPAAAQQAFLARVAVDHFRSWLAGGGSASWMSAPAPALLYGRAVSIKQVGP